MGVSEPAAAIHTPPPDGKAQNGEQRLRVCRMTQQVCSSGGNTGKCSSVALAPLSGLHVSLGAAFTSGKGAQAHPRGTKPESKKRNRPTGGKAFYELRNHKKAWPPLPIPIHVLPRESLVLQPVSTAPKGDRAHLSPTPWVQ